MTQSARTESASRSDLDFDSVADQWAAGVLGEDLDADDWPRPDEGRTGREVVLDERAYWETDPAGRPNTRRNPAWRRDEAIASQAFDGGISPLLYLPSSVPRPAPALCSHCDSAPVRVRRSRLYGVKNVCGRCHEYARTHDGQLPSKRLNRAADRRAA